MSTIKVNGVTAQTTNSALTLTGNGSGGIVFQPVATHTPAANGDVTIAITNNTTLTFSLKGTDGTVRTGTLTLS